MSPQSLNSHPTRSLAQELRARDDEQLRVLLAARADLLSPLPTDISALASRASAPPSISRALDSLNLWEIQVLEALVALPEPITIESVIAATSADAKLVIEIPLLYLVRTSRTEVGFEGTAVEVSVFAMYTAAFAAEPGTCPGLLVVTCKTELLTVMTLFEETVPPSSI